MRNIILILLVSFISLTSCHKKNDENNTGLMRVVFDPGPLKFISTSLNPKNETMSALYGNDKALKSLSNESNAPYAGSLMKLVTWRYHDNPQYTGGTITGELVSIETVHTDMRGNISYGIQNTVANRTPFNKEERIHYFMSYRPVSRP